MLFQMHIMKIIFMSLCITYALCAGGPQIILPDGRIEGKIERTTQKGEAYYSYMGIPFAAPPVGNLRMQPPQAVKPWNGTLMATSMPNLCYQGYGYERPGETEDCLYLNVFTPTAPGVNNNLPVMVSMFAGGFNHGGPEHNFDYFLEEGIVGVSFNYRVGIFGFLSTGDTVIPGNMGLKDQLAVLKWVQKNIHLFGGDPKKVTIKGVSAGSASVTYHMLSPESAGLFRAVIANSGTATNSYFNSQSVAVSNARGVAQMLDPSLGAHPNSKQIHDVLMRSSTEAIHATGKVHNYFSPVVEVKHAGAFITEPMYESVKNGHFTKVPLFIGFNSEENLEEAADKAALENRAKSLDENVARLVPSNMNADHKLLPTIGNAIKNIYAPHGKFVQDVGAVIRWRTDDSYIRGIAKFAELAAHHTSVYMYQFSYHGQIPANNIYVPGCGRCAHGEDNRYLDVRNLNHYPKSDILTAQRYVALFTNFMKELDPTPRTEALFQNIRWQKLNPSQLNYLDIDTNLTMKTNPRNYKAWVEIYNKYAHEPLISY